MSRLRRFHFPWELFAGGLILACFVIAGLAAPVLAPVAPENSAMPYYRVVPALNTNRYLPQPPNERALLGTTTRQQDIYYAIVWGTRNALRFALVVGLSAFVIGTLVGLIGGFFGGKLNWLLLRLTDSFLAVPMIAGVILM
jgi:peptide/nickel transport system permease protein